MNNFSKVSTHVSNILLAFFWLYWLNRWWNEPTWSPVFAAFMLGYTVKMFFADVRYIRMQGHIASLEALIIQIFKENASQGEKDGHNSSSGGGGDDGPKISAKEDKDQIEKARYERDLLRETKGRVQEAANAEAIEDLQTSIFSTKKKIGLS